MKKFVATCRSFRRLITEAKKRRAFFAVITFSAICGDLSAATIDTTGGTTILNFDNPANNYIGNGTLRVSNDGSGLIELDTANIAAATNFQMTGGLITIDSGVTLSNGGWQKGVWTTNRADLNVDGTFDIWDGNSVRVDALSGSGILVKGLGGGSPSLTVGVDGGTGNFAGTINAGTAFTLIKEGAGTQTLSGTTDNNSARATVNNGTLVLAKTSTASVHAIGGGLTVAGGTAQLGGTGGDQIYDGTWAVVNSGTFDMNGNSETIKYLTGSGGQVNNASGTQSVLTINLDGVNGASGTQSYSGSVNGNIRVVVSNSTNKNTNLQTFAGSNNYTGGTLIDNGHLRITTDAGLGAVPGSFDADNITLQNGGVLQNNNSTVVLNANRGITLGAGGGIIYAGWSLPITVNGAITGSGSLTKRDGGELILVSTSSDYSGGTIVDGASLLRATDSTIGTGNLTLQSGGIFFNVSGAGGGVAADNNFQKAVNLGTGGGGFRSGWGDLTISGQISGVGGLTIVNDGAITLTNTGNSYNGDTTIGAAGSGNNATLKLGAANVLPNGSGKGSVVLNASSGGTATFDLNGFSETINGLVSGGAGANVVNNSSAAPVTLTIGDNNATSTYSGTIQNTGGGALSLFKTGSGELILTNGGNSYTGGTTVSGGLLRATDNTIGSGNLTLQGGGIFFNVAAPAGGITPGDTDFQKAVNLGAGGGGFRSGWGDMTVSGLIGGVGGLTIVNDGVVRITNTSNSYNGDTTIGGTGSGSNATLRLGSSNVIPHGSGKGNVVFNASSGGTATFDLNGFSETINGLVSGGAGAKVVNNTSASPVTLTVGDNDATSTYAGTMQNTGGALSLVKTGNGTTTLSGTAITYTGTTSVNQGRLVLQDTGTSFDSLSTTVGNGAVLEFNVTGSNTAQLNGNGQSLGGTGTIVKSGTGQLLFGANGQIIHISQSAGGVIDVQGGTLRNEYFAGNWTANQGSLNVAPGATFRVWDADTTVDALTGSGTINKGQNNNHTLTLGVANTINNATYGVIGNTATFSGGILQDTGTTNIVKNGTGTQTLSGANTYTGTTIINGGELIVDGSHVGGGNYFVNSGARLGGKGTINIGGNTISVAPPASPPGSISPGNNGALPNAPFATASDSYSLGTQIQTVGTLNVVGNVDLGGTLLLDVMSADQDHLNINGNFEIVGSDALLEINGMTDLSQIDFWGIMGWTAPGGSFDLITFSTFGGGNFDNVEFNEEFSDAGGRPVMLSLDGNSISMTATPEPTSIALWVILGLVAMCAVMRRGKLNIQRL